MNITEIKKRTRLFIELIKQFQVVDNVRPSFLDELNTFLQDAISFDYQLNDLVYATPEHLAYLITAQNRQFAA